MPWLAAVAAIGGGVMGAANSAADRDASRAAYEQSVRDYEAIGIPSAEAQKVALEQYRQAGILTPELEEAILQGQSEMGGISTDPEFKNAQMQALSSLQGIGKSGGLTLDDLAQQEKLMSNISADQKGSREAILQNAQARGGYGSGAALAAQLMEQQAGAGRAHDVGLQTAGNAQKRALDAIAGAGSLGTSLESQYFGEAADKATAQDAINQWNAQNSAATQARNVTSKNTAQATNLTNTQSIQNANVDIRNKQETDNAALLQKQFENQMGLAAGKSNARAGQATNLTTIGNQNAQNWVNAGKGVGNVIASYGQEGQNNNAAAVGPTGSGADMQKRKPYKNYEDA